MSKLKALAIGIFTAASFAGPNALAEFDSGNFGQAQPPYESLLQAKQHVQTLALNIQTLIQKAGGIPPVPTPTPMPPPNEGGGFPPARGGFPEGGGELPPVRGGFPQGGGSFPGYSAFLSEDDSQAVNQASGAAEEVLENDQLASLALQVMGRETFELGQLIDQTFANYNSPLFWGYWQQACHKACKLLIGNQGAKASAGLPLAGLITPADFMPNEYELQAVRQALWCH